MKLKTGLFQLSCANDASGDQLFDFVANGGVFHVFGGCFWISRHVLQHLYNINFNKNQSKE